MSNFSKMIQKLIVSNLNGKDSSVEILFNEDLNLFTGRNGCGKTTVLKILWFIQSGHIENLIAEIDFKSIQCDFTDVNNEPFCITISREDDVIIITGLRKDSIILDRKEILRAGLRRRIPSASLFEDDIPPYYKNTTSIFFPTFRRIEGGFGIEDLRRFDSNIMTEISVRLSSSNHRFVASISTEDISDLVNAEYAKRSESINKQQQDGYKEIESIIKRGQTDSDKLLKYVTEGEKLRTDLLKPFSVLGQLTESIFKDKGISLRNLTLGDVEHAIDSDKLSSGEKQILSFLCYNTFKKNSCVFIDEPELSLHPDWQRKLISTLVEQGNNNQYFISTHSPFIYSKYPDKEIILDEDKGGDQ